MDKETYKNIQAKYANSPLLPKQEMATYLSNPYTNENLSEIAVNSYNRYTEQFNEAVTRIEQELIAINRSLYLKSLFNT